MSFRRSKCKRNQTGGGAGGGWGFEPSPVGTLVNNDLSWKSTGNCRDVVPATLRPGYLEGGYTGAKGLPGLSGGGRRRKATRKTNRKVLRKQSGGRYGMGSFDDTVMGSPGNAGIAPTAAIGCEKSMSAVPPSGADGVLNKVGGPLWDSPAHPAGSMRGGAYSPAATSWSEPASTAQSASLTVPTAGLTHLRTPDDIIKTSAGTLEMINVPENGRIMNPACLKTGGGRKKTRKASRKAASRKGSRKASKKGSRKH